MTNSAEYPVGIMGKGLLSSCGRGGWLAVFLLALALYLFTLAPDLTWQDQGDYQYQAAKCNLSRPGDAVRVHPLYIVASHVVGRLGLWNYARAASIVNAVFSAIAVANVYLIVVVLCGKWWPAVLSAGTFALSHTAWFIGTQAQTYGMADAAISGGLLLALIHIRTQKTWPLLLMGLVFGLGMSVHIMTQMGFAVVMIWLLGRCIGSKVSAGTLAKIALCWIAGAVLFWVVVAIEYRHNGNVADTISSAVWGQWGSAVFNIDRLGVLLKTSCMYFVLNFPTPLVLLAFVGVWLSFRQVEDHCAAGLLLACVVVYGAFAARYDIPNQNHFFLPMYMFVSVYIGLGYTFVAKRRPAVWGAITVLLLVVIPPTYAGLCAYARANRMALGTNRHIPYRDAYAYYLQPWQCGQTGPRRLVRDVFEKVPKDSVLLCDSTIIPVFRYAHEIELKRPDISVFRFHEINDVWREMMDNGRSMFVFSDVEGYYPRWVEDKSWLRAYSISGSERIFEIVAPASRI